MARIPRKCESLVAKAITGSQMMKRMTNKVEGIRLPSHHKAARDQPCVGKAPFM